MGKSKTPRTPTPTGPRSLRSSSVSSATSATSSASSSANELEKTVLSLDDALGGAPELPQEVIDLEKLLAGDKSKLDIGVTNLASILINLAAYTQEQFHGLIQENIFLKGKLEAAEKAALSANFAATSADSAATNAATAAASAAVASAKSVSVGEAASKEIKTLKSKLEKTAKEAASAVGSGTAAINDVKIMRAELSKTAEADVTATSNIKELKDEMVKMKAKGQPGGGEVAFLKERLVANEMKDLRSNLIVKNLHWHPDEAVQNGQEETPAQTLDQFNSLLKTLNVVNTVHAVHAHRFRSTQDSDKPTAVRIILRSSSEKKELWEALAKVNVNVSISNEYPMSLQKDLKALEGIAYKIRINSGRKTKTRVTVLKGRSTLLIKPLGQPKYHEVKDDELQKMKEEQTAPNRVAC